MSRLLLEEIEDTAPRDEPGSDDDPLPAQHVGDAQDEEYIADIDAGREHYIDVGPSALRKELDVVIDPKYRGATVSRRDLEEEGSESGPESSESDQEDDRQDSGGFEDGSGRREPMENENTEDEEAEQDDDPQDEEAAQVLDSSRNQDYLKGKAIAVQLKLWDSILDARIRLQKAAVAANRIPKPAILSAASASDGPQKSLKRLYEEAFGLSDDIARLRKSLMDSNEVLEVPSEEQETLLDSQDWSSQIDERSRAANVLEQTYHPHLIATLHKWSTKINAVSPATLLSASASRSSFRQRGGDVKGVADIVEELLRDEKVYGRTRVLRNSAPQIGVKPPDGKETPEANEVFDDTDFYHQLLRDIVESKKGDNGISDAMTLRPPKAKKNVDTKASKGRKIRYNVHEKLQNFMVPIPSAKWHEEQIDELFASLLGKGFGGDHASIGNQSVGDADASLLKDGFRVFG